MNVGTRVMPRSVSTVSTIALVLLPGKAKKV